MCLVTTNFTQKKYQLNFQTSFAFEIINTQQNGVSNEFPTP